MQSMLRRRRVATYSAQVRVGAVCPARVSVCEAHEHSRRPLTNTCMKTAWHFSHVVNSGFSPGTLRCCVTELLRSHFVECGTSGPTLKP